MSHEHQADRLRVGVGAPGSVPRCYTSKPQGSSSETGCQCNRDGLGCRNPGRSAADHGIAAAAGPPLDRTLRQFCLPWKFRIQYFMPLLRVSLPVGKPRRRGAEGGTSAKWGVPLLIPSTKLDSIMCILSRQLMLVMTERALPPSSDLANG